MLNIYILRFVVIFLNYIIMYASCTHATQNKQYTISYYVLINIWSLCKCFLYDFQYDGAGTAC